MWCQRLVHLGCLVVVALAGGTGCELNHAGLSPAKFDAGATGSEPDGASRGTGGGGILGTHEGTGGGTGGGDPDGTGGATQTGGDQGGGGFGLVGVGGTGGAGALGGRGGPPPACGPTTCPDGCCNGNNCVTVRTRTHCGKGGGLCGACASCFLCGEDGTCALDPASTWTLSCQSAVIAPTKPDGAPWDSGLLGAAPDPFCEFQLNEIGQRDTTVALDTLTPTWNQSITPRNIRVTSLWLMSNVGGWSILVGDYDVINNDAVCEIFPTLTTENFSAGTVVFANNDSCSSLTVQLTCDQ